MVTQQTVLGQSPTFGDRKSEYGAEPLMERILRQTLADGRFTAVPAARARTMSAIRATGNATTEMRLRYLLVRLGSRGWKIHPPRLIGNPDFFFRRKRVAIFVDGCFWHGCRVCGHLPKTNRAFWRYKIEGNRRRHRFVRRKLLNQGVRSLRIWEHELNEPRRVAAKLERALSSRKTGSTPAQ